AHRDPEGQRLLEALSYTVREPGRCLGSASVFETRKASRLVEVNDAWLIANAASDAHLELLRQLDIRSQIVVPVVIHENLIGTITCGRTGSEDPFTPEDVAVAEELAARTGVAVENCRLYVESRQATHTRDEVLRIVAHDLRN